jgi:DNA-binding transcriptional LysR family regulator
MAASSIGCLYSPGKSNNNHYIVDKTSTSIRLLEAFAETAKARSFAKAARALGLSASAVTKSVQRLEAQLRVRLFQRTTRKVVLTQEGEAYYARCRRVLDELGALALVAEPAGAAPAGVLRVDVPMTYGKKVVIPVLADLVRRHPELRLSVRFSDQYADIIGSGVDAVVRVGEVADARLVSRRIDSQQLVVCASPGYLERKGRPQRPAEIEAHDCVVFQMPTSGRHRQWDFLMRGKPIVLHPRAKHVVNDGEGLVAAAAAGLGIIQVPDKLAGEALGAGALEEVLGGYRPKPMPISIVFPTSRHMPARLRAFIDALTSSL